MKESSFKSRYFVEVRAVDGAETSPLVSSPIVTFNILKTADVKCALDFPPVQLSWLEMGISVSFPNPFYYYEELANLSDRIFHYKVFNNVSSHTTYTCERNTCVEILPNDRQPYCVQLNGSVMDGRIQLSKTAFICIKDHRKDAHESYLFIVLGVLLAVFVSVSLVIAVTVIKVKAWKTHPSHLPKTLASLIANPIDRKVMQFQVERVECITIEDKQCEQEEVIEEEPPCCVAEDRDAQLERLLEEDEDEERSPSDYGHAHCLDM